MNALAAALGADLRVQLRNGFYLVSAAVVALFALLLGSLPQPGVEALARLAPSFAAANLVLTTFYFVAGLVFLEKAEGTLSALAVTPLRRGAYLAAKLLSLTLLAALEGCLVLAIAFGPGAWLLGVALGSLALGALFTLLGLATAVRFGAINAFLVPSGLLVGALLLPLLGVTGVAAGPLWWLHPVQPALALMGLGFAPPAPLGAVASGLVALGWIAAAFALAQGALARFAARVPGTG